jgi:hypothetical protein
MYLLLKEAFAVHGLEIVFVSSDRDQASFDSYYASMPWLAVPFSSLSVLKQSLSATFGIQGIPSLVVLDAMSGEIVSNAQMSRTEVTQACRLGEEGICALFRSWLDRVPAATKEMVQILEVSCIEHSSLVPVESADLTDAYLMRDVREDTEVGELEPLQSLFTTGQVLSQKGLEGMPFSLDAYLSGDGRLTARAVLETALAYLTNASRAPYDPKFRSVKLSNKIADRITHTREGIDIIECLGFKVIALDNDFYATILLGTDLEAMKSRIMSLIYEA